MDSKDYQYGVERTRNIYCTLEDEMKNYCLGMSSKVGELVGHIKHVIFLKHKLDKANVVEELGDLLWYVTALATLLNINLDEVLEYNLIKLKKRYPDGFDPDKSINREEYKRAEKDETPTTIDER